METQLTCDYLDLSKQNASDMLLNCVQDNSRGYDFNCSYGNAIENSTNLKDSNSPFKRGVDQGFNNPIDNKEGFTSDIFYVNNGPGVSNVPFGKCPDGFTNKNGMCVQVCMNCKYRDNMRSQEFNEADPCFPEGVYDGITNEGYIKCTCGLNNNYCSEKFTDTYTTDGMLFYNNKIKNNIGIVDHISKLFYFEQL